jgi:hypothetical protein
MNDERAATGAAKPASYVGLRIFLFFFSLFFLAGGVSMTLSMGKGVIQRQDWLGAITLLIPVLFGVLGVCGLYGTIFLIPWHAKASASISDRAGETRASASILVSVVGYAFFGIFLAGGLGALVGGCLVPLMAMAEALTWSQTPCVILDARMTQHRDDDSVTYRVSIRYRYTAAGQEITSNRLAAVDKPMSSRKRADALLKQYPPGSERHCYVSPSNPTQAVLISGGFPEEQLIFGFLGLTFIAVGGAGIYFVGTKVKEWRDKQEARTRLAATRLDKGWSVPDERNLRPDVAGGWVLKPQGTPLRRFLGAFFLALVWNGFVAIFAWLWWSGTANSLPWWGKGMIGLFGFIGGCLIWGVGGAFLALFAPRPEVTLDRKKLRLGEPCRVSWKFTGSEKQVSGLNLYVEGIEEAKSGAGSDMKTDTRTFLHIPIATLSGPAQFLRGSETITVPAHSMHSLSGDHNAIRWYVRLKADIRGARSLDETFEMEVGPLPTGSWKRN